MIYVIVFLLGIAVGAIGLDLWMTADSGMLDSDETGKGKEE